jgi:hypothetical protein
MDGFSDFIREQTSNPLLKTPLCPQRPYLRISPGYPRKTEWNWPGRATFVLLGVPACTARAAVITSSVSFAKRIALQYPMTM